MTRGGGNGDGKVLELREVHTYYGSIQALKGISLEVFDGEVVTLIGANGAGKSTTLRSINGLNRPRSGKDDVLQHAHRRLQADGGTDHV